ncbi:MAG: hypothetical protein HYR66_05865 [Sphingobacteriales bacterium]|nr:hypothetical protein [Sphingobacteriales bacterium]MBI3717054.1 hypothetical protein [Sphingobacteriales bacterium]
MILKYIINLSLLILSAIPVYSQKEKKYADITSPKFYWGVTVTPSLYSKAHIYDNAGEYQAGFTRRAGGEILINYYYNATPDLAIVFSAGGGSLAQQFRYLVSKETFNSATGMNVLVALTGPLNTATFYIKTQGEVQYKFAKMQNKNWFGTAGLALLYSLESTSEYSEAILTSSSSSNAIEYVSIIQDNNNNNRKPWINFHIGIGYEWKLNSINFLQAGLKFNYSPIKFVSGTYQFDIGNLPEVKKNYAVSGSYLGINVSYFFSMPAKR